MTPVLKEEELRRAGWWLKVDEEEDGKIGAAVLELDEEDSVAEIGALSAVDKSIPVEDSCSSAVELSAVVLEENSSTPVLDSLTYWTHIRLDALSALLIKI